MLLSGEEECDWRDLKILRKNCAAKWQKECYVMPKSRWERACDICAHCWCWEVFGVGETDPTIFSSVFSKYLAWKRLVYTKPKKHFCRNETRKMRAENDLSTVKMTPRLQSPPHLTHTSVLSVCSVSSDFSWRCSIEECSRHIHLIRIKTVLNASTSPQIFLQLIKHRQKKKSLISFTCSAPSCD